MAVLMLDASEKLNETRVVNKYKETYSVYIGRGSKWGNPFSHLPNTKAKYVVNSREEAIKKFEEYILNGEGKHLLNDLYELKGEVLGCFCKPKSCHGDVLVKLLNKMEK